MPNQRLQIYTVFLVGIVLAGAVLFVIFAGQGRPLLEMGLNLTTTTTT